MKDPFPLTLEHTYAFQIGRTVVSFVTRDSAGFEKASALASPMEPVKLQFDRNVLCMQMNRERHIID